MMLKQLGSHLKNKVRFLFHIPSKNKFQVDQRFIFMKLGNKKSLEKKKHGGTVLNHRVRTDSFEKTLMLGKNH